MQIIQKHLKKEKLDELLKKQIIHLPEYSTTRYHLCYGVGIKNRVQFFNKVEKPIPLKERQIEYTTRVVEIIHNLGFIFKNGVELVHIEKKVFNNFKDVDIIKVCKRL